MTIDSHYIPAFSIEDVLLDKDTGAPLSGGKVYFYRDNQPGNDPVNYKAVYQITGTSPDYTYTQLPNPVILTAIGTFEDAFGNPVIPYFLPYTGDGTPDWGDVDLYRIVVTSSGDVPQFTRDAQPYIPGDDTPLVASAYVNEISNPQFALVNFDTTATYNYTAPSLQEISIAPDWDLIVSGLGAVTVTVTQTLPVGSQNKPTNPGTILEILTTGTSAVKLRQRIYGSPNLWGNGFLSATFYAASLDGIPSTISMHYQQSNGTSPGDTEIISTALTADGSYMPYPGSVSIPISNSTNTFANGYIDIFFNIPVNSHIGITSVMVTFTDENEVNPIDYDQNSLNRQIDHLYHYAYPIVPVGTIIDYFGFSTPEHYVPCDYAELNRIDYQALFRTITTTETVTLTSGMNTFTVADGSIYSIGYGLEGTGIPDQSTITDVTGNTVTMTRNATANGSQEVRFFLAGNIFQEDTTLVVAPSPNPDQFAVADSSIYAVGMSLIAFGTGTIPAGTYISAIPDATHITMSANASGAGAAVMYFFSPANGDGSTTFNVPDARRRNTIGAGGTVISSFPPGIGNQVGNIGGEEKHLQLAVEVGVHTHPYQWPSSVNQGTPANLINAGSSLGATQTSGSNSGGTPFNIIQPGLVTNKCIRFE